ncbi:PolC-type DNA polymerase III [[Mycoplasma] gypis]|uniref:DNA polymerase III PolC-type n=1 Tax=[Mycoplasma] gypis TaxID=92404 RepID=A0ABZ2RRY7_9BACT|nr:PolC-type DNA polymerase III [[Mycoplasma] gypis]MBN0919476.1 PolC-type DNA polymerase III [[Mycoplasma] gypis]
MLTKEQISLFEKRFWAFCQECGFEPTYNFVSFSIKKVTYNEISQELELDIVCDHHIDINEFKQFIAATKKFPYKVTISLSVRYTIYDENLVMDYLDFFLNKEDPELASFLRTIPRKNIQIVDTAYLTITSESKQFLEQIRKHEQKINYYIDACGFEHLLLKMVWNKPTTRKNAQLVAQAIQDFKDQPAPKPSAPKTFETKTYRRSSAKDYKKITLKEAEGEFEPNVEVSGQIVNIEERQLKADFKILTFIISDFTEAITVKAFNYDNKFKENQFVTVKGTLEQDNYLKRKILRANVIEECPPLWHNKIDDSEYKRVELALRTNMSTQDGVVSATDYIETARRYGHKALAICDTDGVQGFPEFYNNTKKLDDLKPIFGATLSAITKDNESVIGPGDYELDKQRYIVFDLETSGLSPVFDEIIEFGAVVIENSVVTERIQFFIKQDKPVSAWTTDFTGITNEMLNEKGISREEAAQKIHSLLSSGVAVAHNANFDISHSKQFFKKMNMPDITIKAIDTMNVARLLFPYYSKFRLGSVAKKLDVLYDEAKAHRADQDANVLGDVWIRMIAMLKKELKIFTSQQLRDYIDPLFYKKKFSYEVRLLAKNQAGLKKLFKIISKASTEDYHNGLRVFLEDLKKNDDILIGTSTHLSYFWNTVFTGCFEDIEKQIQTYDYIEFAPISTYNYKIKRGELTQKDIEEAYLFVIELAKKYNIPCVAVSDARYIDEIEKIVQNVYIFADGIGAKKHWLYNFRDKTNSSDHYPVLNYKTTKEMLKEFEFLGDEKLIKEIVIDNTHLIADQIEKVEVIKKELFKPIFDDSTNKLRDLVYKTAYERYGDKLPEVIEKRIVRELKPISENGYSVIYWISHKLVKKSNDDGYVVGSRGSVGSSLVANLSGISEVNPLNPHYLCPKCKMFEMFEPTAEVSSGWDLPDKICPKCNVEMIKDGHAIPFETFLGFNADKVPDIDLNFSGENQSQIHNYIRELFGETHTFRAGTISTVANKTAFGFAKKYNEIVNPESFPFSTTYIDFLASKSTGVKRTTGQHPGGIIIVPKEFDVEDFTPINYPANDTQSDWKTTHFDFHSIHDNLLKLDILGHDDPTAIRMLERLTKVKVKDIPKSDSKVIELFSSTASMGISPEDIYNETTGAKGLPEFGTQFVRRMLQSAKAKKFSDLISLSGLSHGTDVWTGNAEELIKKYGFSLSQLVCCRDDIMIALMSYGVEPKKSFDIMEKVRKGKGLTEDEEKLLQENKVPDWYIQSLKKIKYMFPKAHATAYVIMAWRIAWFKLYYPLEYYATYFTTRTDTNEIQTLSAGKEVIDNRIVQLHKMIKQKQATTKEENSLDGLEIAQELYARGFKITNVSLEKSLAKEWKVDYKQKALIPPFIVVDSLGLTVAESIVEAREQDEFLSVEDLLDRTTINSRILENLNQLGVLDDLDENNNISLF